MSPTSEYYLDTFSSSPNRRAATVHSIGGEKWAVFRDASRKLFDDYAIQPAETVQIKAHDGTELYGRIIKPANFHAGEKYPAVVMVYGGPGAQTVRNAWAAADWAQPLAARGFAFGRWTIAALPAAATRLKRRCTAVLARPSWPISWKASAICSRRALWIPRALDLRLELRWIHDAVLAAERAGRVPGGYRGSAGDRIGGTTTPFIPNAI